MLQMTKHPSQDSHKAGVRFVKMDCLAKPLLLVVLILARTGHAQQGDKPGETQGELPAHLVLPPAPVIDPEKAREGLVVPEGYRVDLVASEPLIGDPVMARFGADGRLWVVEMHGYMTDIDGGDEFLPVGEIAVLSDADGDGRMDTRTTFLDELVLPRSVLPMYDGALVLSPPDLLFCRDRDSDGVADETTTLLTGFGGLDSPEHAANGLLRGLDNWIYLSQHPIRIRFDGKQLELEPTHGYGQWGIAQDDYGRLYYTPNSNPLLMDLVAPHYAARNPRQRQFDGVYTPISPDKRVYPIHKTPGVNRGYQPNVLTDEGKLSRFTAACSPLIYRGHALPEDLHGDALICEPAGNLIKRKSIDENGDRPIANDVYDDREFLASSDERFRPVHLFEGTDGNVYVVDMYRGILQHRIFMTTFLRKQILDRELDQHVDLGRIYRIAKQDRAYERPLDLTAMTNNQLVELLGDPNGYRRDLAQQQLIERHAIDVKSGLQKLAVKTNAVPTRLHALWTLAELGQLSQADVLLALSDDHAQLRIHGLRLAEQFLNDPGIEKTVIACSRDPDLGVRVQAALTLGYGQRESQWAALMSILRRERGTPRIVSAVTAGIHGRESLVLDEILKTDQWQEDHVKSRQVATNLANAMLTGSPAERRHLCQYAVVSSEPRPWLSVVLLHALAKNQRLHTEQPRLLRLDAAPEGWDAFVAQNSDGFEGIELTKIDSQLTWPERDGHPVPQKSWTTLDQRRYERGQQLYTVCVGCHQNNGDGMPPMYPPLRGSPWVTGRPELLALVLLHGLQGPLELDGVQFDQAMPASPLVSDAEIAAIMTYVRHAWGNEASPVTADQVAEIRSRHADRQQPWNTSEISP